MIHRDLAPVFLGGNLMISGTQMKRRVRPAFAVLLLCLAACGEKEEEASPRPALTAPEAAFPSGSKTLSSDSPAVSAARAEAEATATKDPIKLTLRLLKTKVSKGEPLWYQVELKNIGNKPIEVYADIFVDPGKSLTDPVGIWFEVLSPDGTPLHEKPAEDYVFMPGSQREEAKRNPERDKKIDELLKKWKAEGNDPIQITKKLLQYQIDNERPERAVTLFSLPPGASTTTAAWSDQNFYDERKGELRPKAKGGYAELWAYFFYQVGRHKVRIVYDERLRSPKRHGGRDNPWNIHFETPYIDFEVVP